MRDVGILVWVGLLIVGVVGSMISSLRRQSQVPLQERPPPGPLGTVLWTPPSVPSPSVTPLPVTPRLAQAGPRPPLLAPPAPVRSVLEQSQLREPRGRRRLFGDRRAVVAAIIAAEVLGKPRAFGDE